MENSKLPAFPLDGNNTGHPDTIGLTKREYFAAMAMQGILSTFDGSKNISKELVEIISEESIMVADELLKQLEK